MSSLKRIHYSCLLYCLTIDIFLYTGLSQNTTNTGTLYITSATTFFMGSNFTNNSSATTEDPGMIQIHGNWTNNGTFTPGMGTVIFSGSTEQTLTKPGGETFYRLIINNSSSTGVVLNDSVTVTDSLTLTDGIVFTSSTNILIIANGAKATSGSIFSFVDGPMKKTGNQAFTFPVGDTATWARLAISAPSLTIDEFTAEYFDGRHSDANNTDGSLNNASVVEYWTLTRDAGTSNVTVKLFWEDTVRSGITDIVSGDLVVARYNGVNWTNEGQSAITSSNPGDVTSNTVSAFSPFTFASLSSSENLLPIELLGFNAKWDSNIQTRVKVEWTTASEINNAWFILEHSNNAITWQKIAIIPGSGNSNEMLYYFYYDKNPYDGHTYYRLKQVDFDGSYEYSDIVVVSKTNFIELISIFPNPFWLNLYIGFNNPNKEDVIHIKIADILGRTYLQEEKIISEGYNEIKLDMTYLPAGLYFIELYLDDAVYNEKMVKLR